MGLQNTNTSKVKYLKITNGAIREKVEEGTPNAKLREYTVVGTGEKRTVWELTHNLLTGKVKNIYFKEYEFNNKTKTTFNFVVVDDGVDYVLQFDDNSMLASTIYKMMPNIDVNKEVEISVNEKEGKTSLFINQQGKSVLWAFKKDNMGNCPQLEKIMVKGKEEWDNSKQLAFFKEVVIPDFEKRLKERGPVEFDINAEEDELDAEFNSKIEEDDLVMNPDDIPFN